MTCQTCISWKRRTSNDGNCFHPERVARHWAQWGITGDRMTVAEAHHCEFHEPKAILVEAIEERAAIMEFDGGLSRGKAETMAAVDVRAAMFREGRAR